MLFQVTNQDEKWALFLKVYPRIATTLETPECTKLCRQLFLSKFEDWLHETSYFDETLRDEGVLVATTRPPPPITVPLPTSPIPSSPSSTPSTTSAPSTTPSTTPFPPSPISPAYFSSSNFNFMRLEIAFGITVADLNNWINSVMWLIYFIVYLVQQSKTWFKIRALSQNSTPEDDTDRAPTVRNRYTTPCNRFRLKVKARRPATTVTRISRSLACRHQVLPNGALYDPLDPVRSLHPLFRAITPSPTKPSPSPSSSPSSAPSTLTDIEMGSP